MSQASDLPDPLDKPSLEAAPSADDLLAQMAGEEIDRLLDDAAVERPADGPGELPPQPAPLMARESDARKALLADPTAPGASEIDKLLSESAADLPAAADAEMSDQLNRLFEERTRPAPRETAAIAAETPDGEPGASPEKISGGEDGEIDPAEQTGALERQVLSAQVLGAAESAMNAPEVAEDGSPGEAEHDASPWYVQPLEWINAPIAGWSDTARELMGRAAILTLVNTLLVLIYVLFIRPR